MSIMCSSVLAWICAGGLQGAMNNWVTRHFHSKISVRLQTTRTSRQLHNVLPRLSRFVLAIQLILNHWERWPAVGQQTHCRWVQECLRERDVLRLSHIKNRQIAQAAHVYMGLLLWYRVRTAKKMGVSCLGRLHQEIGAALVWPGGVCKCRAEWRLMFRPCKTIQIDINSSRSASTWTSHAILIFVCQVLIPLV